MTLTARYRAIVVCVAALLLGAGAAFGSEAGGPPAYLISGVEVEQAGDGCRLTIKGSSPPTYTVFELFEPLRLVVDIAEAGFASDLGFPLTVHSGPVSLIKGQVLEAKEPAIARLEILLTADAPYTVVRQENSIVIAIPAEPAPATAAAEETEPAAAAAASTDNGAMVNSGPVIETVEVAKGGDATRIIIRADGEIATFTPVELPAENGRPARLYIDVPGTLAPSVTQRKSVDTAALRQIRVSQRQEGMRIVLDSNLGQLFQYQVSRVPAGLMVTVQEPSAAAALSSPAAAIIAELGGDAELPAAAAEMIEPEPEAAPADAEPAEAAAEETRPAPSAPVSSASLAANEGTFEGYEKQPITVDFYKIDLHNVFRLFGEISGMNIVVDEGVGGSLTLALSNVPWDFALDIILNLKGLQKEERFNTIVISPKDKQLIWPKGATAPTLAVKADSSSSPKEAIAVKQRLHTPKEVVEAKKLIGLAQIEEKAEKYEGALEFYEKASALQPEDAQLANHIASLSLVRLGQNAKAVHYARKALSIKGDDAYAALNAAIALANMKKNDTAATYFELATQGAKPPSEALISYAAFQEQHERFTDAIRILDRHEQLYGDTLDTLVAKARVFDRSGHEEHAVAEYRAILLSGFDLPPDLTRYIKGRLAVERIAADSRS